MSPGRAAARGRSRAVSESGYWELQIDSRFHWRNRAWVNNPNDDPNNGLVSGFPVFAWNFFGDGKGFGFFEGKPAPRFRVGYKDATQLGDGCYYSGSSWLICSRRLAAFLRTLQPDGVAILPIEVELKGGEIVPAGEYVFLDVTLRVPTFDAVAMNRRIVDRDGYLSYEPDLAPPFILRKDIPPNAMLFRDTILPFRIFAAHAVREACRSEGLSRRLYWKDPAARF